MAREGGEWVLVRAPPQKDRWNPSGNAVEEEDESSRDLKLKNIQLAQEYTAVLESWFLVVSQFNLHLNEDTLWTGIPGNYTNKNAPKVLAEVRKLVDKRKYLEATDAAKNMLGHSPDAYLILGDIRIEFDESHLKYSEESYHRELDLDKATAKIKYNVGDIEFTREHFVSYPDQVIVTRLSTSKSGSLPFTVSLESDNRLYLESKVRGNNQIIMEGSCLGYKDWVNNVHSSNGGPKGIQFAAVLDIQISNDKGVIHVLDDKKLRVEGSDWAILLLTASSSFDGPFTKPEDSKKDPTFDSLSKMKSVKSFSYENLYARHLDDYQNLFHRVSLQLCKSSKTGGGYGNTVPTPERVQSFQTDEDPSFVELLFQYGRYLLISCSRPGTQVANLQGIWNTYVSSEFGWGCSQHFNINLQMNYWPSLSCNLQECQEPFFDYISSLSINGSKTPKR